MHHAHQVEHAVEVALLARGHRHVPQLPQERFRVRPRRRRKPAHRRCCDHAWRVAGRERLAVGRVAIGEGVDALTDQEMLKLAAQGGLARIFTPPPVVDRPVGDRPPAVVAELRRPSVPTGSRRTVEIAAVGRKAGVGAGHLREEGAADLRRLGPEGAVLGRAPARPKLIEGGQVIGGIGAGDRRLRHEAEHVCGLIDHRTDGHRARPPIGVEERGPRLSLSGRLGGLAAIVGAWPRLVRRDEGRVSGMDPEWRRTGEQRVVPHSAQDLVRLGLVIVDALAVAPAVRGEQQRHRIIFLAVWRGARRARRAVGAERPGEIADGRVCRVRHLHVGLRPVPQRVELALVAELDGDHHAVAHAFRADVVVRPIGDVGEGAVAVGARLEIDALLLPVAVEELLESAFDPGVRLRRAGPELLGEEVAIVPRRPCAGTVRRRGARSRSPERQRRRTQSNPHRPHRLFPRRRGEGYQLKRTRSPPFWRRRSHHAS